MPISLFRIINCLIFLKGSNVRRTLAKVDRKYLSIPLFIETALMIEVPDIMPYIKRRRKRSARRMVYR